MPVVRKLSRKGSTPAAAAFRRGIDVSHNTGHNILFPSNWTVGVQLARHRRVLAKKRRKLEQKAAVLIRNECTPPALPRAPVHFQNRRSAAALSVSPSRATPVRRYQLREVLGVLHHQSVSIPHADHSSAIRPNGTTTNAPLSKGQKFVPSSNISKSVNAPKYGHEKYEAVGQLINPSTATSTVPKANNPVTVQYFLPYASSGLVNQLTHTVPQTNRALPAHTSQGPRMILQGRKLLRPAAPPPPPPPPPPPDHRHDSTYGTNHFSVPAPFSIVNVRPDPRIQGAIRRPKHAIHALRESERARQSEDLRIKLLQRGNSLQMPPVLLDRQNLTSPSPSAPHFGQLNSNTDSTTQKGIISNALWECSQPDSNHPRHAVDAYLGQTNLLQQRHQLRDHQQDQQQHHLQYQRRYLNQQQKEPQLPNQQQIQNRQSQLQYLHPSQQQRKRAVPSNTEDLQRKRRKPVPVTAAIRNRVSIMNLPVEIMKMVYGNLVLSHVNSLRHTCGKFYEIFKNEKRTIPLTADFSWFRSSIQELEGLANNAEMSKRVVKVIFVDIQPINGMTLQRQHPNLPSEHVDGYNKEEERIREYHCAVKNSQVLRRILNKFRNLCMLEYHAGYLSETSQSPSPHFSLQEALSPTFIDATNDNIAYQRRLRAYGGPLFQTPQRDWAGASIRNFHRMISYVLHNRHRKGRLDVKITTSYSCGIGSDRRCRQRFPPSRAQALRSLEIYYRGHCGLPSCEDWLTMSRREDGPPNALRAPGFQFDGLEELTLVGNPKDENRFMMVTPVQDHDNTFKLLLPNLKKLTLANVTISDMFIAWAKERALDILLKDVVVRGGGLAMLKQDPALQHIKTVNCVEHAREFQSAQPNPKAVPPPPIPPSVALEQMIRARHEGNKRLMLLSRPS